MHRFERDDLKLSRPHAFVERRAIRFQDIDAAGIIFYPRVLEMFHDAYVAFLAFAGCPLPDVLKSGSWLAPVRHAEADYFKPLRFGDEVTIEICRAHLAESEATLGYRIVRLEREEVCAVGQVVHTFVDQSFKRLRIPDAVRRALAHIESAAG
ncbi:MAG TPA: thioesterase family protein [Polyangiaceae bacterium]|nr:thioesterase family protein [Polyangiaceae bacterium]